MNRFIRDSVYHNHLLRAFLLSNAVNSPFSSRASSSFPSFASKLTDNPRGDGIAGERLDASFNAICEILKDPSISSGHRFHAALDDTGFKPDADGIWLLFNRFIASPELISSLFDWAVTKPGFELTPHLLNSVISALGRRKEFGRAWCLILDCLGISNPDSGKPDLISIDTFSVLIRRYSHEGFVNAAFRSYEYASSLGFSVDPGGEITLFSVLLDALCKTGHASLAYSYFNQRRTADSLWTPPIRIYNTLLQGWLRAKKFKQAEKLWSELGEDGKFAVRRDVASFSIMIEGYCRLGSIDKAIELFYTMKTDGISANSIVFNTIIDALAGTGRLKEASGMMERFLLSDASPDTTTFNSLVKGYCKADDIEGANKVIKKMINEKILPSTTTYNNIFKCYAKSERVQDAIELYSKMIESGYIPNRQTYHLMVKILTEDNNLEMAMQICGEMRSRGMDWDMETGTMMINLFCSMERHEDAFNLFVEMAGIGVLPQSHTICRLSDELRARRMIVMAKNLSKMMASVPTSGGVRGKLEANDDNFQLLRKNSVLRKAEMMSEMLKTGKFRRNDLKKRQKAVDPVGQACRIIEELKTRACQLPDS